MTGIVVDASVAVKWVITEAFSENAARLLDGSFTLLARDLLYAEVTSALWSLARRGDISGQDVREALAVIADAPIDMSVPMRLLMPAAARWAQDLDHPVYDCFYLALALQEQYPLVTADKRFYEKVRSHPYLADCIRHVGEI